MFIFSDTSITGRLPEKPDSMSDNKFRMVVCANALNDWGICMAGATPPEKFGDGVIAAASFLGVNGSPDSFMEYAEKMELLKIKTQNMKWLNLLLFQWFFFRITRCEERVITKIDPVSFDVFGGLSGYGTKYEKRYCYAIQGLILPLTGWKSDFVYFGKRWLVRVSPIFTKK